MKIKKLILYSNDLDAQKSFYSQTLGFELQNESNESFSINVGWSILTFEKSKESYHYHYCFLIPSNQFDNAFDWFSNRLDMISLNEESTFDFEDWNAKSFYFYDGNNNVAECIVRYDLDSTSTDKFGTSNLLCINEIGMPSSKIKELNDTLETSMSSNFWKGNFERFATNGDQKGLFLLVNNDVKKIWFPTEVPTQAAPFKAEIKSETNSYNLTYSNQELIIDQKVLVS